MRKRILTTSCHGVLSRCLSENVFSRPDVENRSPASESLMGLRQLKLKPMSATTSCTVHLYLSPSAWKSLQLSDRTWEDASHSGQWVTQRTTSPSVENKYQWHAEPQLSITPHPAKVRHHWKQESSYSRDQIRVGLKIILIVVGAMLSECLIRELVSSEETV